MSGSMGPPAHLDINAKQHTYGKPNLNVYSYPDGDGNCDADGDLISYANEYSDLNVDHNGDCYSNQGTNSTGSPPRNSRRCKHDLAERVYACTVSSLCSITAAR